MFLSARRRQGLNNLLSVEAPVFDKYLAGMPPSDDHASQMNPRHIAFERVWVERRFAGFRIEPHPQALNKREVRMIARQREHASRGQSALAGSIFNYNFVICDSFHMRLEHGLHLAGLDAILNVRPHPILNGCTKFLLPMHQRHTCSVSIEIDRRPPVVFQRFDASVLFRRANQRQITDLKEFRRREKHHVHWVTKDRIAEAGFVDDQGSHSRALGLNGRGKAGRASTDANNVVNIHGNFSLPGVFRNCKLPQVYCFEGISRSSLSSRRNASNSFNRSGVASISFFFHTNTSPELRFSLTLRFPSSKYDGDASNLIPPCGTADKTAAQSPFLMHKALS